MFRYRAKYLLSIFCTLIGLQTFAQTSTISNPLTGREQAPYSIFGIGEEWNGNNTVLKGMANMTSAFENPYEINTDNPASYSFLGLTTYEAGAMFSERSIATSTATYPTGTATLSYLNIGFPIGKNAGLCIGFKPMYRVYYDIEDTENTAIGKSAFSYTGSGAVNMAFIGGAYKYKGFSLGVNAGLLFGSIRKSNGLVAVPAATDTVANEAYNSTFTNYTDIAGLYWKAGGMYEGKISKNLTLRVGGTVTLQQNVSAKANEYWIGYYFFTDTTIQDTANTGAQIKGKMTLPMFYSFGVQLAGTDKWDVGIDYSGGNWSHFRSNGLIDSALSGKYVNSYRAAIGGELTPNASDPKNYLARVTYRLGFYYGRDFAEVYNTMLPYYGVTVGASLPFKRSFSHFHGSLDIGRLGSTQTFATPTGGTNYLMRETYIRFTLGISFNDRWFIHYKEQ